MLRLIFLTFVIFVSTYADSDEEMADMRETITKCMEEFKFTDDTFKDAKNDKDIKKIDPCFMACIFKANGVINDKGMFDPVVGYSIGEKMLKNPSDLAEAKKIGEICSAVNDEEVSDGDKGCERAMLLSQCLMDNTGKGF